MHENTPLYNSTYTMTPFSDNTGPIGGTDGPIRFGSLRSPVARQHPPTPANAHLDGQRMPRHSL